MKNNFIKLLILISVGYVFYRAILAFEKLSYGTGTWLHTYSVKWGMVFIGVTLLCVFLFILIVQVLWRSEIFYSLASKLIVWRKKNEAARFGIALLVFIFPIWLFQFTVWGVLFGDLYIRIMVWAFVISLLTFLLSKSKFMELEYCLGALLLTSTAFVITLSFINVTDYPFSMGWSEGNRMWDFSMMFGKDLYDYPPEKEVFVLLDPGRQFVGGLPFIFSGVTIWVERFWIALTAILPYLLVGIAAFRFMRSNVLGWAFAALWAFIFLKQGPIHTPLVLCAVATAFVWRSPLWLGIPLIAITSYVAEVSRFTWIFAPGMWIGMLELIDANLSDNKISRSTWIRAIMLGISGLIGGQYGEKFLALINQEQTIANISISVDQAVNMVASPSQPLLWYRLLPTEIYPLGILFGLLIATLPLIILLLYLVFSNRWQLNIWQKLVIFGPLSAFLVVGLIVSAKIGGGGDLHNMDMFLIGLMFTGVVAWDKVGKSWFREISSSPAWIKLTLVLFFALPGLFALRGIRSFEFAEQSSWVAILLDLPAENPVDMIPADKDINKTLKTIQEEVDIATAQGGEVLFIDQRQLLTFGYITDVPFVPEYEKKVLMNNALGSRQAYFQNFYDDLAAKRFALIISEPLRISVQDSTDRFGEENNAWVTWVSNPLLCFYDIKTTLRKVNVQLLVPKDREIDCSSTIPMVSP
jgi:hypothetical protein